ncbi:arginine deiminase family protein [Geomicrobium sp. JCM 19039]|uniref:arginine deiminase family protein n=1 Tax=Geomicrobium sp. JCM 19039 TaxID=1460636 RepID=UPI00045F3E45|nr:arginine deiminase family protein [Geomicrobium sp. JCM 19039]GAK11579.1 NG,NG-dimethylarginine dimethylaminohydrolase 1 [Geomicrobium sp. JCM 19039]
MKITHAIVKEVSENFSSGLTEATLGKPDLTRAREQHANYVQALKDCGVQVTVLPADDRFPDSTFVEDPAVVLPDCAILTRPGTPERIEETALMRDTLTPLFNTTETIVPPGTLEGGDVLRVENHVYIGISDRTNEKGATQLMEILTRLM